MIVCNVSAVMELMSSLLWSNMSLRDLFSSRSGGVGLLVRNSLRLGVEFGEDIKGFERFEVYRSRGGSSYCGLRCTEVGVVPLIVVSGVQK